MLNRSRVLAEGLHLPLKKLALCLDCDECFELGHSACPACGSATWTPAARFLKLVSEAEAPRGNGRKTLSRRAAEDAAITKHLLIVARHRRELYDQIKRAFAGPRGGPARPLRYRRAAPDHRLVARAARSGEGQAPLVGSRRN